VLQLRLNRPARGRLRLVANGTEIAGRHLSGLPERRVTLPLPPQGTQAEIRFEED
jgi:hypothetical protein